jgi:chromosome segregation ATPase
MRVQLLVLFAALAVACASDKSGGLNMLDRSALEFKVANEKVRADDLEARYKKLREKADRLAEEVLRLGVERDRLFDEYDKARASIARLKKQQAGAQKEKTDLAAVVIKLTKENDVRRKELEKLRKDSDKLRAELQDAAAKKSALAAATPGEKAPG